MHNHKQHRKMSGSTRKVPDKRLMPVKFYNVTAKKLKLSNVISGEGFFCVYGLKSLTSVFGAK